LYTICTMIAKSIAQSCRIRLPPAINPNRT
jgi:hypothetical protein